MKTVIITELRIYKVKENYYADSSFSAILKRYKESFGDLTLITRIIEEAKARDGYVIINNSCECFVNTQSLLSFVLKRPSALIRKHIDAADLVIMRLPSVVAIRLYPMVKKKKYFAEVVGCAWDAYWNHSLLGKIFAPAFYCFTKKIIRGARYATYVTKGFLQKRYPNTNRTVGISDVSIDKIYKPKTYSGFDVKNFAMMTAGGLDVKYKGQEYVIRAIGEMKKRYGVNIKYYLAGKGEGRRLKRIAEKYNVNNNIIFLGMLPKDDLIKRFRNIDFYIQPSLQEGLPRSVVEAMSCGCVCLGSTTAGIPELLEKEQLFKRKNVYDIIRTIRYALNSDLEMISNNNTNKAKEYLSSKLDWLRNEYYNYVKKDVLND